MARMIHCRFCNKSISEADAYGCPTCGSYICEQCFGPDGDVCILCAETGEDGNLPHEEEEWDEGDYEEEDEEWEDEEEDWEEDYE